MKKRRITAAVTSAVCLLGALSVPTAVCASENRDKVYETSLVLPEDIAYPLEALKSFLWDSETQRPSMDAFTELDENKKIIIVADNEDVLAIVKAFVKEKGLDENLIGYRIESFENMVPSGIADDHVYLHWDEMTIDQQYFMAESGDPVMTYSAAEKEVPADDVGDYIGKFYMSGYDWYEAIYYHCETDAYKIKGNDNADKIAVRFDGDEKYYLYTLQTYNADEEQLTGGGIIEGDANCDSEVNMSDSVLIMQSLSNPDKYMISERGKKNADTNNDGITNADALVIQKKLLGL